MARITDFPVKAKQISELFQTVSTYSLLSFEFELLDLMKL